MHVLVIEDDPVEQRLTKARLGKAGCTHITVCASIDKAARVAEGHQVAILDLGLSETSGMKSLAAFRATIPDMPLVVLTADDSEEHVTAAIRGGADEYLVKANLATDVLRRALLTAIERHQAAKASGGVDALAERLSACTEAVVLLFQHPHETLLERCLTKGVDAMHFHFVDMTQRGDDALVAPKGVSFIGSPVQLEKASMRVFQACRTMEAPTVFIDSVATLALYNGDRVAREFLDGLTRRLELAGHRLQQAA